MLNYLMKSEIKYLLIGFAGTNRIYFNNNILAF